MAFGRRFGELTVHPFAPTRQERPELIKFRNDETKPPFGTDVWHSDETFRAEPPMATMLCAKEVPAVGGDTMFVSMSAAYDGLSDRMQQLISGLEAIHDMKPFRPLFGDPGGSQEAPALRAHVSAASAPGGAHPPGVGPQGAVRQSAVHGRHQRHGRAREPLAADRCFTRPHSGIPVPPSLGAAHDRHVGQPSTQHYAVNDYYPQRRYMERVTIRGGPVTGLERADPASIRPAKYVAPKGVDIHGGHKPH